MENSPSVPLIIGVTLAVIVLLNVGIILIFRKGTPKINTKKYQAYGNFLKAVRNPLANTDKELEELSGLMDQIKNSPQTEDED